MLPDVQKLHVATGIFMKYKPEAQVGGEHDELFVWGLAWDDISDGDLLELKMLGWVFDPTLPAWRLPT